MDGSNRSRSRVEERLTRLESEFGAVEVTQTTFEVDGERYRRAAERAREGHLDIRVVVRNGDGAVLLCEGDGGGLIPRGRTEPDERLRESVRRIVHETAAIDCTVTDAASATIRGIRNGDDAAAGTVYRLSVVFTAEITDAAEAADESVRWDADPEDVGELV